MNQATAQLMTKKTTRTSKRGAVNRCNEVDQQTLAKRLLSQLTEIRSAIIKESQAIVDDWASRQGPQTLQSGTINLAQYLALRRHDLSDLRHGLSVLGLSSLAGHESCVRAAIDAVCTRLSEIAGEPALRPPDGLSAPRNRKRVIGRRHAEIFGVKPHGGSGTRIMVTLPARASEDRALVADIIRAGANCLRINCAHGGPETWSAMIENSRAAAADQGAATPIFMDIGGPKCRIAEIFAPKKTRVFRGDRLKLVGGNPTQLPASEIVIRVTLPAILKQLKVGAQIFFDDGCIAARVEAVESEGTILRVEQARGKGEKLRLNKGLNFPDTELDLPPLTDKDLRDLNFVAEYADLVGFSFVQRPSDVRLIQRELAARRNGRPVQPLVLKIETALAVRNLPELIAQSASQQPLAIMIARGDLAVEVGYQRLGEVQESILRLCAAAHVPVILATEVLDTLLQEGTPTRAEVTDAAMGQRAQCVMLNKGPFIVEAVRFLDTVLRCMNHCDATVLTPHDPLVPSGSGRDPSR
jgi:pyruvate kinase